MIHTMIFALIMGVNSLGGGAWAEDLLDLARLTPGKTYAQNALWIENPLSARFNNAKQVVVAEVEGPGVITMIHFAMPETLQLDRSVLLRMFWDDEPAPSVDCPLVDFFCDPAGARDEVNTALVNKRRGFNAYFPMPFRRSARIELDYDGPVEPGEALWKIMPCYSYVMVHTHPDIQDDTGYFHASWRQEGLLLGQRDYLALEATGPGKFIGWNVSVRRPGRTGYPVDENAKFYIDGEATPSVELQGIEDSFGFSWGFPPSECQFPYTGYFPFLKGAMAYRFFVPDAISFSRSIQVTVGFGVNEHPMFRQEFSKPGNELQLSSTVYWYQKEPHAPFPPMLSAEERRPAPENPLWPGEEKLPSPDELQSRGVKLLMLCGRPEKEVIYQEPGYNAEVKQGYAWDGFTPPVYYCRADNKEVVIDLTVPKGSAGRARVFAVDSDFFQGGRKQEITVGKNSLGILESFKEGKWLEIPVSPEETQEGTVTLRAKNLREGSNAVISIIEWLGK